MKIDIEQKIKEIIAQTLGMEKDICQAIKEDAPLFGKQAEEINGFSMDSIDALEIVAEIENTFQIEIPDEVMDNFTNVKHIADYVREQQKI